MADYLTTTEELTSIADAIRTKGGTSAELIYPEEFVSAIESIETEPILQSKSATPTETAQEIKPDSGYDGLSKVNVGAISSTYVGSGIARKDSTNLSASGATVTAPAGYYATAASKSVASGSVTQNAPTVNSSTGLVTATSTVTAGYVSADTKSNTLQLSTQGAKTVSPTESEQTVVAAGKYTTGAVKVGAISSTYVGSDIPQNDSEDLSVSGRIVTASAGYYEEDASASVPLGTVTSGTASITSISHTYNSSTGKFDVSGSANVSAPTVGTAGYVSTDEGTKNAKSGGATVSASVNKIVGSTSITGTAKVTPTISKQSTPSGVTNAASGNATTTAPTSGVYVAVKAAGGANTITATPSVTTAGYGDATNHGITGNTLSVGANDSAMTYVPITTTSASVSGKTVSYGSGWIAEGSKSVADGSVTQNAPTVNSTTGLVTATSTVTAGYVSADTKSNTLQLSTQAAATITPGTSAKTAVAAGKYTTGAVSVAGDADLVAGNIKKGVDIFGVTGTFTTTPSGKTALTAAALRSGYSGFINGSQVDGSMADTSVTEGTTTISSGTATRGAWSQTAGYTAARTIPAATFANEATSGTTYVDISSTTDAPILIDGDNLYINKGYTDNLKISLAKLVPDGSDVKGHGDYILSGHSAYDNDGTLVAGTIPTKTALTVSGKTVTAPAGYYASNTSANVAVGTVTSGTATITSLTKTYNSTSGNFDITGSADVSAPSVGTAGYISSTEGTKNKTTGGATVSTTIDKIAGSASISATTKKPSITKRDVPSGVTQAASGNATTTAPTSGVYVAVKSNANTATLTPTVSISTAGYGDSTNHGISASGATVGAAASDTTYVPITTTSASVSGRTVSYGSGWITEGSKSVGVGTVTSGSATISSATYTYNSTNGNFGVTGSASIGAPSVGTEGYISSTEGTRNGNTATLSTAVAKIVGSTSITGTTTKKPSITKQNTPSGVTNAASGSATTTKPSSGVYVAVKSAANTGTLTATPSVTTEGYGTSSYHGITGNTATVGASASDTTYIPITTTSASVSGATVSYGSGWITAGSKTVSSGSVTQNAPTVNSSTGLVTATSTVTAGYVSADTKSNTLQLSTQAATTITPGTSDKTAVASGKYTTGTVKVAGSSNLTAANIKSGVTIFGVTGTYSDYYSGKASVTIKSTPTYSPSGYSSDSSKITVSTSGRTNASGTTSESTLALNLKLVPAGWSNGSQVIYLRHVDESKFIASVTISAP